jgi:hypothetical protein
MFQCLICMEQCTGEKHECRQCKVLLCDDCMFKYMQSKVGHSALQKRVLKCPHCQIAWHKPRFYIEAEGGELMTHLGNPEDESIRVRAPAGEFYLHGIHDNIKFVGYVCLVHTEAFYDKHELSYHVDDLAALEPYAKDVNELFHGLSWGLHKVIDSEEIEYQMEGLLSAEDHIRVNADGEMVEETVRFDAMLKALDEAACNYLICDTSTVYTGDISKFIKSNKNPF